jgi:hypothetical protein
MTSDAEADIRRTYERWHQTVRDSDLEGCLALHAGCRFEESTRIANVVAGGHSIAPSARAERDIAVSGDDMDTCPE